MSEGTGAATGPQSPGLANPDLDDDETTGTEPEVAGLGAGELEDEGTGADDGEAGAAGGAGTPPPGTGGLPADDEPDAPPSGAGSGTLG